MATIIKSDNVANNHLGSVLPVLIPAGFVGFFDFSSGQYKVKGNTVQITDIVKTSRITPAVGLDRKGNQVVYPANVPRLHYVTGKQQYGLASGDVVRNHFLNSTAPVTQNITIDDGTDNRYFILVSVEGTGSLTVSGGIAGTATEGNPLIVKVSSRVTTLTATVNGALTFAQVSKITSPYGLDVARLVTGGVWLQKSQDVNQVNRAVFDTLYGANGELTTFIKLARFDGGNLSLSPNGVYKDVILFDAAPVAAEGGYVGVLEMIDGNSGNLYVRKQRNGAVVSISQKIPVSVNDINILAFTVNKTKAKIFFNGVTTIVDDATEVNPKLNFLPCLLSTSSSYMSPNSVLTKMIVYDKVLSDQDIATVYNLLK